MSTVLKSIYEYSDYRVFLKDYFLEQKQVKKAFSHRFFANAAGFTSSGFLAHVMDGKRNLTSSSLQKLMKALGLRARSATFFECLVQYNQAKSTEEKSLRLRALEKMKLQSPTQRLDENNATAYFQQWYFPALRELAVHTEWNENFDFLGGLLRPPLTGEKTQHAIETLVELRLLEKRPDGKWVHPSEALTTEGLPPGIRRSFRLEMMMRAVEALDSLGKDSRHISGITVAMSEQGYTQVSQWMDELRGKILQMALQDETVDKVYHFNFQGFPLSTQLPQSRTKPEVSK